MKKIVCSVLCAILCTVQAAAAQTYTVQKGDTLWKIASRCKVGLSELVGANPQFADPNLIYPGDTVIIPIRDAEIDEMEREIVELVNAARADRGLHALTANWELSRVAGYKACDLRDNHYFGHDSPVYGSPFRMMRDFGIVYTAAGENIAKGQHTAQSVMQAWMQSTGHRANILNSAFTQIGVGYCAGEGGPYWVQMFMR